MRGARPAGGDPFEQFFRQFGDQPRRSVRSLGSGFVINATATS